MQQLIIIGNLGSDAQVTDIPNGNQVVNFNVAVSEKYKDQTQTTWYKCAYFKNDARVSKYLLKGTKVAIIGKPDIETYTTRDGEFRANLKCIVFQLELLSQPKEQAEKNAGDEFLNDNRDDDDDIDDGLPF